MAQYPGYQSGISINNNNNAPCPPGQRLYQGSRSRNLIAINPAQLDPLEIEEWQTQEEDEEPRAIYIGSRSFARMGQGQRQEQRQGQEMMLSNGFPDNDSDVSNYYALTGPRRRGSGGFLNSQAGSSSQDYNPQLFSPQQPPQPCMFQNEFVGVPRIFPGQQQPLQSSCGNDYQTVNVIKTLWRTRGCKKKKKCCNPCGCPTQPCCKPSCCQPCYQPCCKPKKKKCYREMVLVKANNNDPCKESENIYLVKSIVNCKRKPSCVQPICCSMQQQQCQPTCYPQQCCPQPCQKVCCKVSNPCNPCKSMVVCCQKVECPSPPPTYFNPCNPCNNPCNPCNNPCSNPCNPCNNPCLKPCCIKTCPPTQICLPPCPQKQQPICTTTTNTIPLQETMSKCYISPVTENCCTIQECCDVCPPPCPPKKPDMCCFEEEDDSCCPMPPPRRCSPPPSICIPSPPPSTCSDDPPVSSCPPPPKKCKPSCPKPCKPEFVCPPDPPRRPVNICFQPQDICCQQQQLQQRPCNFNGSTVACNTECVFSRPIDFECASRPSIPYERQESCSNVESTYELYWTGNSGNVGQDSGGNRSNKVYSRWNC